MNPDDDLNVEPTESIDSDDMMPIHEVFREMADAIEQDDEPPIIGCVVLAGYHDDGGAWKFESHFSEEERFQEDTRSINQALNLISMYHRGLADVRFPIGVDDVRAEQQGPELPSLAELFEEL